MQLQPLRKKNLVNLTPLIDVVFILLIFFMLASNFTRWHTLELSVGETKEVEVDPLTLSIVSINPDSSYALNKQPLPLDTIMSNLRKKVAEQPSHPIVIQPEQGANVQALVDILNLIKKFAGDNVSIAKATEFNQDN